MQASIRFRLTAWYVGALALTFLYGSAGILNETLMTVLQLKLPPVDFLYSPWGVILAEMTVYTPFVMRPLLAAFSLIDVAQIEVVPERRARIDDQTRAPTTREQRAAERHAIDFGAAKRWRQVELDERRPLHSELSGDAKVGNRRRHGVEPDRIHATRMRTFGERASTAAHP